MNRFLAGLAAMVLMANGVAAHQQMLEGTEWGVVGEEGAKARFISFAGSGRVFGFGGCNRFSGKFEQHDEHLTISPLAATKMACPGDAMTREAELFDILSKVRGVKVDHTLLLLLDADGKDLKVLTRRNAEPAPGSDE